MVKRWLYSATQNPVLSGFISLLEKSGRESPDLLRVLTYHRVARPDALPPPCPGLLSATPENFDRQMAYLSKTYHVLSMPELLNLHQDRANLPARSVLITFDDAYRDFAENAWPVLKSYSLAATVFVPTSFPDHPERTFWWDQLYQAVIRPAEPENLQTPLGPLPVKTGQQRIQTYKRLRDTVTSLPHSEAMAWVNQFCQPLACQPLDGGQQPPPVLSWEELRQLAREGVTLGAHTRTHPLMDRISTQEALAEAAASQCDLEQEIGSILPIFAYPGGSFNDSIVTGMQQQGFLLAFTTERGLNRLHQANPLRLRRINVGQNSTLNMVRAQLLPWNH